MKNSLKLFTISIMLITVACGGGNNSIEAKKANLEKLKATVAHLSVKLVTLNMKTLKLVRPVRVVT
jgi:hypothetical protein